MLQLAPVSPDLCWQGAEAKVCVVRPFSISPSTISNSDACTYEGSSPVVLAKHRLSKAYYRHPTLDARLCKQRMLQELRCITRARQMCDRSVVRVPAILAVLGDTILMEYIWDAKTVKDALQQTCADEQLVRQLGGMIGAAVAEVHNADIIHGDLTTSNMLFYSPPPASSEEKQRLVLIDFGLAQVSKMAEDRAVDLCVLERTLLSTHTKVYPLLVRASHDNTFIYFGRWSPSWERMKKGSG